MNCFFLTKLPLQCNLHKICIAFYLLRRTYFNDGNVGRKILMNSQLKKSFSGAATRQNETKLRKTEKTWKKNIIPMKVTSVKMRYQI